MSTPGGTAKRDFWGREGTFAIVGGFEGEGKLSWMVLEQCAKDGIAAAPVNPDLDEVLGVKVVRDPGEVAQLAGIVCVRLDPHATAAVERAAELGVPVWLSQGTVSASARSAARRTGVDLVDGGCPLMYLGSGSHHALHRFIAKLFRMY